MQQCVGENTTHLMGRDKINVAALFKSRRDTACCRRLADDRGREAKVILKVRLLVLERRRARAAARRANKEGERRVDLETIDLVALVVRNVNAVVGRILSTHNQHKRMRNISAMKHDLAQRNTSTKQIVRDFLLKIVKYAKHTVNRAAI